MFKKGHISSGRGFVVCLALFCCVVLTNTVSGQLFDFQQENVSTRFEILAEFNRDAILDHETQLIWERSPSVRGTGWTHAPLLCATKTVGGRKGWRLPTFLELMTLVDPSGEKYAAGTVLPTGHPFQGIKPDSYWTVTSSSSDARHAYAVDFVAGDIATQQKSRISSYWCVRGGVQGIPTSNLPRYISETL